jgi:radical SAM superfamily enzyme
MYDPVSIKETLLDETLIRAVAERVRLVTEIGDSSIWGGVLCDYFHSVSPYKEVYDRLFRAHPNYAVLADLRERFEDDSAFDPHNLRGLLMLQFSLAFKGAINLSTEEMKLPFQEFLKILESRISEIKKESTPEEIYVLVESAVKARKEQIIGLYLAGIDGALMRAITKKAMQELMEDGLLINQSYDSSFFAVNLRRRLELLGGNLHAVDAAPGLFSRPLVFAPPSETQLHVLRLELTQGCRHNACTFCPGYKGISFHEKTWEEAREHYMRAKEILGDYAVNIRRVFIGGGNALSANIDTLIKLLGMITHDFPDLKRISLYGRADSIVEKGADGLKWLKDAGLGLIYWGVESGSQNVLDYVNKRVRTEVMYKAGELAKEAGIDLSVMVMPGLGGYKFRNAHAEKTAKMLAAIDPKFITMLCINPSPTSAYARRMEKEMAAGTNRPLTEKELLEQIIRTIELLPNKGQKIGMFHQGIDPLGKNPITFKAALTGKHYNSPFHPIRACNERLRFIRECKRRAVA